MGILIIVFLIIFVPIAIFTYLIIAGANIIKTKEEMNSEDLEQIK